MKYIGIFCSASDLNKKYTDPACILAEKLALSGYDLVWGASDRGLMKLIADAVQTAGRKLIGVTIDVYKDVARETIDELIVAKTLGERKATILLRSDAIVVLVGGVGTLDELTDVLELKKQGMHNKPIIVLNTLNFYDGLKVQLQKMKADGFIDRDLKDLIYFADTPEDAINYLAI
ncbi:MAG: TIGR00730 family Rossman fold protein [Weeksellaceae bacterium]